VLFPWLSSSLHALGIPSWTRNYVKAIIINVCLNAFVSFYIRLLSVITFFQNKVKLRICRLIEVLQIFQTCFDYNFISDLNKKRVWWKISFKRTFIKLYKLYIYLLVSLCAPEFLTVFTTNSLQTERHQNLTTTAPFFSTFLLTVVKPRQQFIGTKWARQTVAVGLHLAWNLKERLHRAHFQKELTRLRISQQMLLITGRPVSWKWQFMVISKCWLN